MARTRRAATGGRRSWLWVQGLLCGAVIATAPGTALLVGVLLAPAIATLLLDQKADRATVRCMLLMGAASTFAPLRALWAHSGSLDTALDLLSDPGRPLLSWLACGAGWLTRQTAEVAIRLALSSGSARRTRLLQKERDELRQEWIGSHTAD